MAEKSYNERHIVEFVDVKGKTCMGCGDTKTDIMITFRFKGGDGDFHDVFLNQEQAIYLSGMLVGYAAINEKGIESTVKLHKEMVEAIKKEKPKKVCPQKVDGSCPLSNVHCIYPACEK